MFKKSRRKIVASIMTVLVLLWVGTLGVIYASSYFEMKQQNMRMLRAHTEMYSLPPSKEGNLPPLKPFPSDDHGFKPGFDPASPRFQLSTFYTVALSNDGTILEIKNDQPTLHTDQDLEQLAKRIIKENKNSGKYNNLTFYKADKGEYILVAFMDNTVINESAMTLFRYTLIFGGVALILFFFLSVFLAKKIVTPLEESYLKQKQFISDAGHELKTPISVVSANAELLSRNISDNQWLRNIQYENERMGILVGQLLDLARTENAALKTERIDFSHLVSGEALPFESVAFEKGLMLKSDISNNIFVDGNSVQLKQLISILLDNAISHSKAEGDIRLILKKAYSFAELSVINKGDDISPKQQEQIFERFYRMDSARTGDDKHYGLGLAIAKAIVKTHHGHIKVQCYDGLVEFRIQIPAQK